MDSLGLTLFCIFGLVRLRAYVFSKHSHMACVLIKSRLNEVHVLTNEDRDRYMGALDHGGRLAVALDLTKWTFNSMYPGLKKEYGEFNA